jgi:hypothetical protein
MKRGTPKGTGGGKDMLSSAIKQDDHNRDAKQRHRQPKSSDADVYDGIESGAQPAFSGSPVSSRSSSISSETDSFSSDDSDVAQVSCRLQCRAYRRSAMTGRTMANRTNDTSYRSMPRSGLSCQYGQYGRQSQASLHAGFRQLEVATVAAMPRRILLGRPVPPH